MTNHRPKPVRKAELARLKGVTRGAVTRAASGPLKAACLPGGLMDLAHPAARKWLDQPDGGPTSNAELLVDENALTVAEAAKRTGIPLPELTEAIRGPLARALVPLGHVSARTFAWLSGTLVDEVRAAARGELADAVTPTGRLDLDHQVCLTFMAARPFPRKRNSDPVVPEGYLASASVGDDINLDHPVAKCFLARCLGRVPNSADVPRS